MATVKDEPIGYELRHVIYSTDEEKQNDLLVLNEYRHFADGRREKHLRLIKNYERDIWVAKPGQRNYEEKKQWEDESKLDKYKTTEVNLYRSVNRILGTKYFYNGEALDSPYLYGCGTTTQSEIKKKYFDRWEKFITPMSSVAVLDTETDVVNGTEEVILVTVTLKSKVFCGIVRSFLNNTPDGIARDNAQAVVNRELEEYIKGRNINVEYGFFDTAGQACEAAIKKLHEWQPDFVISWNMDYDIGKVISALEKDGYNLADTFSDPRIPPQFRWFKYKQGPDKKLTQDGSTMGLAPYERWHIANFPATWFWACAMTTYYRLRMVKGKLPGGYSLEATLKRHLKLGKLKFQKCSHLSGLAWHVQMQSKYKYEYIAYNIFDCIGVELLDEKNKDFALKFNNRCKIADYTEFKSNPRMAVVKLNYMVPQFGKRLGVNGGKVRNELDTLVVKPEDWTMTLPSFIIEDSKFSPIQDLRSPWSLMYLHVSDLDISSTYPAVQVALNISKSTCMREVVKVEGLNEYKKRKFFLNLLSGISSSMEVCNIGFGYPTATDALDIYQKEMNKVA